MQTLQPSPHCKALIAGAEQCAKLLPNGNYVAYPDPGSPMGQGAYPTNGPDVSKGAPWTIGYGETGGDITRGTVWPPAKCESRFDASIARMGAGVNALLAGHPTTQNQFDALVSFAFNCGLLALHDSTLLKLHLAGDFGTFDPKTGKGTGAAGQFGLWNKSKGRVLNGLVTRRAEEATLYCTP